MHDRPPSLQDVAREAAVSVSTVSRFINGQLSLRPDTAARIRGAMKSVGYQPQTRADRNARARHPSDTTVLGLVVPQIGNTYFGRIADAIVDAADGWGIPMLLTSTLSRAQKERHYVELLAGRGVDGIIYAGNNVSNSALAQVIDANLPVVIIDEELSDLPSVDMVLVDDYAGAYQAVTYLLSLGHRRIAFAGGSPELRSVRERTRGWQDALERAGVAWADQLHLDGTFSEGFGAAALSHILAAPDPPTAVFAASDTIALGMLAAARRLGVDVPGKLSIVGFDDVPASSLVTPRLTTVHTPVDEMAQRAVTMITERIKKPHKAPRTVVTSVSLVPGGSTCALDPAANAANDH